MKNYIEESESDAWERYFDAISICEFFRCLLLESRRWGKSGKRQKVFIESYERTVNVLEP